MNGTDIIITAVEGGINYWAEILAYTSADGRGSVTLADEDGDVYTVTAGQATEAARKVVELYPNTQGADYIRVNDIDAEAADMIVQVACYGEIVYG